jgi:methionyl-tRNA formyltransferase
MRIVFMGSPDFALPTLRRLLESDHEVVAVYTQPDRPVGRGRKLAPPPVKELALEHGLDVRQPESISAPDSVEELRRLEPDVGVLAAYGQILKQPVLDAPRLGILNVHASLLPRWRGAAPVVAAILAGDDVTGATIMRVEPELDAGPILDSVEVPVAIEDNAGKLTRRIADAGARLLVDVLPRWEAGEITPREQDDSVATYAPRVKRRDALIDWEREDAVTIWRKVRAYNPWPMAYTYYDGKPLRILEALRLEHRYEDEPGTVFPITGVAEPELLGAAFGVVTRDGDLGVVTVQAAGGRPVHAADFINGHRELLGSRLRSKPE